MEVAMLNRIAERFASLPKEHRRAVYEKMRLQGINLAQLPILPAPVEAVIPLSYAQNRLWFMWQFDGTSTAYHIPAALKLKGQLDHAALQHSFDTLIARHASLRTIFTGVADGSAEQRIQAVHAANIELTDLGSVSDADRDIQVKATIRHLNGTPFDLTQGPLMRIGLIRLAEDEHILVVVLHHIISDGWSMQVIVNEFSQLYRAHAEGRVAELAALPIQYTDYAAWQRNWLEAGERDRQLAWWKDQLGEEHPVLQLSADYPRQAIGHYTAGGHSFVLPPDLVTRLKQYAQEQGATLFMVLLAGFQALLYRYTGQTDIRVGSPIANRHRVETEGIVGFFVNTQVLNSRMHSRTLLSDVVQQARNIALGAQAHQDLPFEQLVEALQPERSLSHNPLFQVMYNHLREDYRALEQLPGLTLESQSLGDQNAQFELGLDTTEFGNGELHANLNYARELFEPETIRRMGGHYVKLLQAIAEDAEQTVGEVVLLDESEQRQLDTWSRNETRYGSDVLVHQLFEQQAQAQPDAVALIFGDAQLSYGALNTRANRLAHHLIHLGIGPESRVGIAVERSLEMVIGLLAILKAGAAYVPLDPEYPQDRLAYMMQDSGIDLLLTQTRLAERLAPAPGLPTVWLDSLESWMPAGNDVSAGLNPDVRLHPEQLAYVIYTSGSTGRPKGVAIGHRALVHFLHSMCETPGLTADDVLVAATSLSFDIAGLELYLPLTTGASIVIAAHHVARDGFALAHLVEQSQATVLQLTPSGWRMLLAGGFTNPHGKLKGLVGGEALHPDLATQLTSMGIELWDMYGPTETTIWSATGQVNPSNLHLGPPIAATQLYVLDERLQHALPGTAGELYIGGIGLARGYLGRSTLSAERFIANPFSTDGSRLYRTGDLARWRQGDKHDSNGRLEYLGRIDHQVKIRGFRIELGEIETALLAQPSVREAVVIAQATTHGARLVAYISGMDDSEEQKSQLTQAIARQLPDYMVPACIVVLDKLPLNSSGKVDRKVLPAPEQIETHAYEAPEGETEQAMASIWSEVLNVTAISRHDNFFELGGDSILSLQIVARARIAGWKLTPRQIFEWQTIASQAQAAISLDHVSQLPKVQSESSYLRDYLTAQQIAEIDISEDDIADIYPLSPTQEGMLFHSLESPGTGLYVNQLSLEIAGLDADRLIASWEVMIERHPVLRTGFLQSGLERPLQVVFHKARSDVTRLDWRNPENLPAEIAVYADIELKRPFNFFQAPLSRLTLIWLRDDRYHMIWTQHHMLLDAWGDSRLLGEWLQQYGGVSLPPPGPSYGNYIRWLGSRDADITRAFWEQELADVDGATLLAECVVNVDKRPGFKKIYTRFNAPETLALKTFAKGQRVTVNTVIQAAWGLMLQRYTGKDLAVFGALASGRSAEIPGIEEMLGIFINIVPVPVVRQDGLNVSAYLQAVQETNLRLREYEYTSLADIQRWLGSSGKPLFDSIIVFENYPVAKALQSNEHYGLHFGEISGESLTGYAMDLQVNLGEMMEIEYCYSRNDFSDDFVLKLRIQMEHLIHQMMRHAQTPVGELTWLPNDDMNILLGWGVLHEGNVPDSRPAYLVHEMIASRAFNTPEAIALMMGEEEMSYAALNARANRLASWLIAKSIGPEVRVGIAMERSLDVIVTLLAVLKAGGAYVPLDPAYPTERLSFMMKDSGIAMLIGQQRVLERLSVADGLQTLAIDHFDFHCDMETVPQVHISPDNLAYIIYTSGSTGTPKGVAVSHGPLAMHCQATARIYGMNADSRELLFMSFSFDGAHERWLTALTTGASLTIRDNELWSAEQTYDALHRYRITNTAFPPAYLGQIADWAMDRDDQPPVELYVFGGEAMPKATYDKVRATLRPQLLINGYGPTETVVTPLIWKAQATDTFKCAYAPIGRPVGERTAYVLDDAMQPVPIGLAGELYIGGYGLARGYLGHAALSAERFLADPFANDGKRIYRTGDRVRWLDDGNIEYLGRIDHQVKIRGFRIELGEIEARLREYTGVLQAVINVNEGVSGSQLAAYVVLDTMQPIENFEGRCKQYLTALLPDYMVPSHIEVLQRLPVLPSGKLDRSALHVPGQRINNAYIAPRNALEQKLADIWQQVLRVERVCIFDNFFELGGDSILSLQVVSKVRNAKLGFEFKLRDLMRQQTIAALVSMPVAVPQTVATVETKAEGEFALTPIQAWFFEQGYAVPHHFNQSMLVQMAQSLDTSALEQALQVMGLQHASLRLRYYRSGDQWLQAYAPSEPSVLWQREAYDSVDVERICDEAQRSLDLQNGPIWRAVHISMENGEARLLLALHHLIVDGVSWRILLEDLQIAYAAALQGVVPKLPLASAPFKAWSQHIHQQSQSAVYATEIGYWQSQLADMREIPRDYEDAVNFKNDAEVGMTLAVAETERLLRIAPAAYRTSIDDLLLTALSRTFKRWRGDTILVVNMEGHGREGEAADIDLSRTLGWFTAAYPLKLDAVAEDIGASILSIKASLRNVPNKGLGYGALRYLGDADTRNKLAGTEPRVTFNYFGQFNQELGENSMFKASKESRGQERDNGASISSWLEIIGHVYQGALYMEWQFSLRMYERATIESVVQIYREELLAIIDHCAAQLTTSDEIREVA